MAENRQESIKVYGKENRLFEYDLIRVTSMFFVVAVHSLIVFDFANTICCILFYLL